MKFKVRVVDTESNQIGIMHPRQALSIAQEKGLDLVEVAPKANPPVCRIMDYDKYRYKQSKKEKIKRQNQKGVKTKEIILHPATAEHGYQFKKRNTEKLLLSGAKITVTISFKGRQISYPELGKRILARMVGELSHVAEVLSEPMISGYTMSMVMVPKTAAARC